MISFTSTDVDLLQAFWETHVVWLGLRTMIVHNMRRTSMVTSTHTLFGLGTFVGTWDNAVANQATCR